MVKKIISVEEDTHGEVMVIKANKKFKNADSVIRHLIKLYKKEGR